MSREALARFVDMFHSSTKDVPRHVFTSSIEMVGGSWPVPHMPCILYTTTKEQSEANASVHLN